METDFLAGLNKEQRAAVEQTDGPVMVIAGAGSGKTRVLTFKVAHLIQKGIEPFHILALTFTNRAATEMKERIIELVKDHDARNVWMGTFHSVFAKILRIESDKIGFPPTFSIYDTDDSKSLIKAILKDQNLDPKTYNPSTILNRISLAKTNLMTPADYTNDPELVAYDQSSGRPMTGQIYTMYQAKLKNASAMDFDDILFFTNVLLRDHPDALYKYQQKFKYILVDEYQDTNYSQYIIIKRLAANNENICVVGDDAQSIYAFRGAHIENIFNFQNDYPDYKIFKLEQNYRSTRMILNATNSLIQNNRQQIKKDLWTQNEDGAPIGLIKATSDTEEGMLVAHSIFEQKMNFQLDNDAFAILYRTNAQSRAFEEALRKLNIPYRIFGGLSFYKRKEIKDLISYFRLVVNPADREAFLRVVNYPARGIGQTTVDKLLILADEQNVSLWEVAWSLRSNPSGLNSGTVHRILDFVQKIRAYQAELNQLNAFELAHKIAYSSGMIKEIKEDDTPEGVSRLENIEELLNAIKDFCDTPGISEDTGELTPAEEKPRSLAEFLSEVSLLTDLEPEDKKDAGNKVSLMTVHAAKGLEFPYVYVVGMEEDLFPSYMSMSSRQELEEERRLFYVAMTRAMKKATLSYAQTRYRWGNLSVATPSRFINEIKEEFLEGMSSKMVQGTSKPIAPVVKPKLKKLSSLPSSASNPAPETQPSDIMLIEAGMQVEHASFGTGTVQSVEGNGPNKKATVRFPGVGDKQLLLRFAKLRIIS